MNTKAIDYPHGYWGRVYRVSAILQDTNEKLDGVTAFRLARNKVDEMNQQGRLFTIEELRESVRVKI